MVNQVLSSVTYYTYPTLIYHLHCLSLSFPSEDTADNIYYFNFQTGESTWEHPCDEFYRTQLEQERNKRSSSTPTEQTDAAMFSKGKRDGPPRLMKGRPPPPRGKLPNVSHTTAVDVLDCVTSHVVELFEELHSECTYFLVL